MIYSTFTGLPYLARAESPIAPVNMRLSRIPLQDRRAMGEFDNWACLLRALSSRLRSTVGSTASVRSSTFPAIARELQEIILECADDLDLLQAALNAESLNRCELRCGTSASEELQIAQRIPCQ